MAERRMFAKSIVLSDTFLDMPLSARCLYFTLGMLADDDGFVGNPKSIMRQCGASQDDMVALLQKRYVLGFESGVIVIKHWKINNYLRSDRYQNTTYLEEKETLTLDAKNAYTERDRTLGIPVYNQVTTNGIRSIGKDSIDKHSIDNNVDLHSTAQKIIDYLNQKCGTKYKASTVNTKKHISARLNDGYTYEDFVKVIDKKCNEWKGTQMEQYLRPDTLFGTKFEGYLNQNIVKNKPVTSQFHQMEKSNYDFGDLEKKLLNL
jgi:uncharacterized phage protein (TIGR02220 family)